MDLFHNNEDKKDEFVESLNLTPDKIRKDMEKMKEIEGFPIGDDDDILELSNPPYYTAYPNPYIKDFINKFGTIYNDKTDDYHCAPYVGDVASSKNNMIYRLHSYLTKVPSEGIKPFIKHYTKEGDIILDVFSGTGMTGIAAQDLNRKAILLDLSPLASFVSYYYNKNIDLQKFKYTLQEIIDAVKDETSWMYETNINGKKAIVNFVVWSINYSCPHCGMNFDYYSLSYSKSKRKMLEKFLCKTCNSNLSKKTCLPIKIKKYDDLLKKEVEIIKYTPVLINYSFFGQKKGYEKQIENHDIDLINKIDKMNYNNWVPIYKMMFKGKKWGDSWRAGYHSGIEYVHQFYFKRTLYILSVMYNKIKKSKIKYLDFYFTSLLSRMYKTNRFIPHTNGAGVVGPLSGTLYLSQLQVERNPLEYFSGKLNNHLLAKKYKLKSKVMVSTQSSTQLSNIPENSIDYIFIDPPFGDNLMYSELNFLNESWLKVFSNVGGEAIINKSQNKDLDAYHILMKKAFCELFKILKPNRWLTVEFHNSRSDVWRCIQEGLNKAGFIIGQVAILDKKKGTTKQLTYAGTVKNDLVINAYKPTSNFSNNFLKKAGLNLEKEFVDIHLEKLPISPNIERTQQMLYSKLLAQYIQNGFEVRMDAADFYKLLKENFIERDGYWFKDAQIKEYEKRVNLNKNLKKENLNQMVLFISDEKSAILWLYQFLVTPKTYDEIFTEYSKKSTTSNDQIPELKVILEENFVTEDGKYRIPSVAEKKQKEDIREKRLLREFQDILEEARTTRKIKEVRKEALLHGLMKLYKNRDVEQIKLLGKKLDSKIVCSDDDISAIIDWAMMKE